MTQIQDLGQLFNSVSSAALIPVQDGGMTGRISKSNLLAGLGSGSGGSLPWLVLSASETISSLANLIIDAETQAVTVTLPANPTAGNQFFLIKLGNFTGKLNPNGKKINGVTGEQQVIKEQIGILVYVNESIGWLESDGILSLYGIDPYFSSVSLLLPCNGANNSTSFIDLSPTPKTIIRYADTKIVTDSSALGGSSAYFDGVGDSLEIGTSNDFVFSGDFTVEMRLKILDFNGYNGGNRCPFSFGNNINMSRPALLFAPPGNLLYYDTDTRINTGDVMDSGVNHHIAWVRSSGTHILFIDGINRGTYQNSTTINPEIIRISGSVSNTIGNHFGNKEQIRITKGIARYTSNFTPPTNPHLIQG